MWQPTADDLTRHIKDHKFNIVPLPPSGIAAAVQYGDIDFVITTPSQYVSLELRYGIQRILTLQDNTPGRPSNFLGSVIFTRSERTDINSLADIKGKRFVGVDAKAYCGFLLAQETLHDAGIDPHKDFSSLTFSGFPFDNAAFAVRDGLADVGTMRATTFEDMIRSGILKRSQFKILNAHGETGYPLPVSTKLYPHWPLAVTRDTDTALATVSGRRPRAR